MATIEDRVEALADEAIRYSREKCVDHDESIRKIAEDYGLNDNEIKLVCYRTNQKDFAAKFSIDKEATFKIAKFENIIKLPRKEGYDVYESRPFNQYNQVRGESYTTNKVAEEADVTTTTLRPQDAAQLMYDDETVIDTIKGLRDERAEMLKGMRHRVKELLKNGATPQEIYNVLLTAWGEDNITETTPYFNELMKEMQNEGVISGFVPLEPPTKMPDIELANTPIKQDADKYAELCTQQGMYEIAHATITDRLDKCGYDKMAEMLERKMPDDYIVESRAYGEIAKIAAGDAFTTVPVPNNYLGIAERKVTSNAREYMRMLEGALPYALTMAAVTAGMMGVGSLVTGGINKVRKETWREKLRKKFPELQQIPEDKYNNIYNSIVGLEPSLTKAPYALAEMIKTYAQYGTIDSKSTLALLSSGRGGLGATMPATFALPIRSAYGLTPQTQTITERPPQTQRNTP